MSNSPEGSTTGSPGVPAPTPLHRPYPQVLQQPPSLVPSGMVGDPNGWDSNADIRPLAPLPGAPKGRKQSKVGAEDGSQDGSKEKKTRNRKPSSCVQCRRKKLRCNRANPCDQCTTRGEADRCEWDDATPLFNARAEHDAQELREQVARLESLVRYLTSQPADRSPPALHSPSSPALTYSPTHSPPSPTFVLFPSSAKVDGGASPKPDPPYTMDLRANDLCEALSQLAIREFVVVEGSGNDAWAPGGGRGETFLAEARVFMDTLPQRFGLNGQLPGFDGLGEPGWGSTAAGDRSSSYAESPRSSYFSAGSPGSALGGLSPAALGSASFHRAAPPLADVLKFLPSHELAMSAYQYFCGYVSWYSHPVHLPTFELQWADLRAALQLEGPERERDIDPFFIATFLGVLAMGLAMMPEKRAQRDGFVDKDKVVDYWLEGAMVALTCGRFLDNPSVEAVRAVVVISTFFVFLAKGESSGAGMGLLSLAVQVAMSLSLHRDPDRTPSKFTFFEAEERRRLFWNLFMLCILSSASLGRTWSVFDLNGVDTKLPLDCHDTEIVDEAKAKAGTESRRRQSEETAMTSLICKMKLAVMAKKINDAAFGIKPVAYKTILDLDRDLKEFEETIPSRYHLRLDEVGTLFRPTKHVTVTEMRACMIQISLASEFIRIHRPWIVLASTDEAYQYSRDQAIYYSRLLLAIFRSPSCARSSYGGLMFKATSAAVVLGIEVLTFPDGSDTASHRAMVRSACLQMETHKDSSLARKGARILRFLLEKDTLLATQREQDRATKRQRTRMAPPIAFPSRLRDAFNPARPASPPREEVDLPRRKPTQGYALATPQGHSYHPAPPQAHLGTASTLQGSYTLHAAETPSYIPKPSPPTTSRGNAVPPTQNAYPPTGPSSRNTSISSDASSPNPHFQPLDFGSSLASDFDFNFHLLPTPAFPATFDNPDDARSAYYTLPGSSAYDNSQYGASPLFPPTPVSHAGSPSFPTGPYPPPHGPYY